MISASGAWTRISARGRRPARNTALAAIMVFTCLFARPEAIAGNTAGHGKAVPPASTAGEDTRERASDESADGPERLKQRTHVTIETNIPPPTASTDGETPSQRSFHWRAAWEGWNGLSLELNRKTFLGQVAPGIANLETFRVDRALRDPVAPERAPERTNAPWLSLQEATMAANLGVRFAVDAAGYVAGREFTGFDGDVEVRRARVYAKGDCLLVMPVSYQIELGYVPWKFSLEDTFVSFKDLGFLGRLKIGQFQPPMSLDAITSSRDITLMELAAPVQALAPGSDAGFQIGRPVFHEQMTWAFGLFSEGVGYEYGDASQDFACAVGRLTWLPIYQPDPDRPDADRLLHLGLSANVLYSGNSTVRYQSRPESYLAPYVVDTGDMSADGALVIGGEVGWVNGPLSLQGEYLHSFVKREGSSGNTTLNFDGFYSSVGYFLTGESRPYDRRKACFARVVPNHNLNWGRGGWGAWELAGRYSFVNLNSGDIAGGRLSMLMAGVNWYLHSHVKWRFEYGFGHVSGHQPEGNLNIFQTRIEVDF